MDTEDPEGATPMVPSNETEKRAGNRGVKIRVLFVLIVALLIGAAVAVSVVLLTDSSSEENVNNIAISPTVTSPSVPDFPIPAPVTERPVAVPTAATANPSPAPVASDTPSVLVMLPSVPESTSLPPSTTTTTPLAPVGVPLSTTTPVITLTATPTRIPVVVMPSTLGPTSSAVASLRTALAPVVLDADYLSTSNTALEWLVSTAQAETGSWETLLQDPTRLTQQYSLLTMDLVTQGSLSTTTTTTRVETLPRFASGMNECAWVGVTCANGTTVTHIHWSEQVLQGSIPDNIGLLTGLAHLDLGDNELRGAIPQPLYNLVNLQYLYLHSNQLSGSISESVANLFNLRDLFLSNNQLTGSLPQGIGSPTSGQYNVRPLRYLTVYDNNMIGRIPLGLNLRNLFYLDLGRNSFEGTIPIDWYEGSNNMASLRHLHLDYNIFSGELNSNFPRIGSSRMDQIVLNDNQFSGEFPGGWDPVTALEVLRIHNNQFWSVSKDLCIMSVFVGGEVTDLRTDCAACGCNDIWCRSPYCV